MPEVVEEIKALGTELKGLIEKANGQATEAGKVANDTKSELQGLAQKQQELLETLSKQQKDIDGLALQAKRPNGSFGTADSQKSLFEVFGDRLQKAQANGGILNQAKNAKNGIMVDDEANFGQKAVGDLSTAGNITGTLFTLPQVLTGVQTPPAEEHIRQYMTTGSTNSNLVRYVQALRGEGGFGMVAEGGLKPQLDYDLTVVDAPVRKIAGHIRVPEEMVEDIPFLTTLLATLGMEDLKLKEDEQVLYGTGTGDNLKGVFAFAQAFNPGAFRVVAPNLWDILVAMRLQIRKLKYRPTAAFVSPTIYALMRVAKDGENRYLFPMLQTNPNGSFSVDGVTIVENMALADGDIIMGNFQTGVILLDRKQAAIRSYDQDRDNAIRNLITFVIEERVALPVPQPLSFVKTTVDAATTALTAA
ncbi:phage major capsid protein [Hymenobacter coalescens]